MVTQFNELNKGRYTVLSIGPKRSVGIAGCILAAILIGAGGCRSTVDNESEMQAYTESLIDLNMTGGELLKETMVQLEAERNDKAIVLLYLYLDEFTTCGGRLIMIKQDVRFKLASLLMSEDRMDEAALILEEYLDSPLAERESEAREMLGACTSEIGEKG